MVLSPFVQRAQSATLAPKGLDLTGTTVSEADECGYCGYSRSEGASLLTVEDGVTVLCRSCSKDAILGKCGHKRTCDCLSD